MIFYTAVQTFDTFHAELCWRSVHKFIMTMSIKVKDS